MAEKAWRRVRIPRAFPRETRKHPLFHSRCVTVISLAYTDYGRLYSNETEKKKKNIDHYKLLAYWQILILLFVLNACELINKILFKSTMSSLLSDSLARGE